MLIIVLNLITIALWIVNAILVWHGYRNIVVKTENEKVLFRTFLIIFVCFMLSESEILYYAIQNYMGW